MEGRVEVRGKFFFVGDQRLHVKGVTYGPFKPDAQGCPYGDREGVERDFDRMVAMGVNTIRTYTVPPRWLLDAAADRGLFVMVGLPWEQHVTFLDDRAITRRVIESVRDGVRACAGHRAVFCYAIGNEIPSPIVRWYGRARIERFIKRLYAVAKAEDPHSLVTYVNYPSTEYLYLPFTDFDCFNVYLESQERLEAYLGHLHNNAGERPLVLAEIGLDSLRNGEEAQARTLLWQIRTVFESGGAGAFVFAWTDEWHRGGFDIEDWAFGIVDRRREPKLAAQTVEVAFEHPLRSSAAYPKISVVVCTYNGAGTIRECLTAVAALEYDDYEVIVVNDGSTDETPGIVGGFDVERIDIPNGGLSHARNIGLRHARGEIVAYIDDDAYPDPDWLTHLAIAFQKTKHVGIGGPNLPPAGDGVVADCVANSPGGPSHVLLANLDAEHLPGCNMAFRRSALEEIDGFDEQFRIAGDDVDLCWRLLERGGTLGFAPGAVVWHHRRGTVRTYLKQQLNYGAAEGMLEAKWPGKYNRLGHLRWGGRLYGQGHTRPLGFRRKRVDQGVWGTRLFQSMYASDFDTVWSLMLMPEWYLVSGALGALSLLGLAWAPLLWVLPLFALAVVAPLVHVCTSAARARFSSAPSGALASMRLYALTGVLHALQPLARLIGRFRYRLTPWRRYGAEGHSAPLPRRLEHWSETWRSQIVWLESLERSLQSYRVQVRRGSGLERWDLHAVGGLLGGARLISTLEEHGGGKQLVRVRVWPRFNGTARILVPLLASVATVAALDGAWLACAFLGLATAAVAFRSLWESGAAIHSIGIAVEEWKEKSDEHES